MPHPRHEPFIIKWNYAVTAGDLLDVRMAVRGIRPADIMYVPKLKASFLGWWHIAADRKNAVLPEETEDRVLANNLPIICPLLIIELRLNPKGPFALYSRDLC